MTVYLLDGVKLFTSTHPLARVPVMGALPHTGYTGQHIFTAARFSAVSMPSPLPPIRLCSCSGTRAVRPALI